MTDHPTDPPSTPPPTGWTLAEALPIVAGETLSSAYDKARADLAAVPQPISLAGRNWSFESASPREIQGMNERARERRAQCEKARDAARLALWTTFRQQMLSGRFAARGRVGSILGETIALSPEQWSGLVYFNAEESIVGDGRRGGVEIHGVRIISTKASEIVNTRSAQGAIEDDTPEAVAHQVEAASPSEAVRAGDEVGRQWSERVEKIARFYLDTWPNGFPMPGWKDRFPLIRSELKWPTPPSERLIREGCRVAKLLQPGWTP